VTDYLREEMSRLGSRLRHAIANYQWADLRLTELCGAARNSEWETAVRIIHDGYEESRSRRSRRRNPKSHEIRLCYRPIKNLRDASAAFRLWHFELVAPILQRRAATTPLLQHGALAQSIAAARRRLLNLSEICIHARRALREYNVQSLRLALLAFLLLPESDRSSPEGTLAGEFLNECNEILTRLINAVGDASGLALNSIEGARVHNKPQWTRGNDHIINASGVRLDRFRRSLIDQLALGAKKIPPPRQEDHVLIGDEDEEIPGGSLEEVRFTVVGPSTIIPGDRFNFVVWAHLAGERQEAYKNSLRYSGRSEDDLDEIFLKPSAVSIEVQTREIGLYVCQKRMRREAGMLRAHFSGYCPEHAPPGEFPVNLNIRIFGLTVARLEFVCSVGRGDPDWRMMRISQVRVLRAFACFADDDSQLVEIGISLVQKLVPRLSVDLHCTEHRRTPYWSELTGSLTKNYAVFYLFWSDAASGSPAIEHEWRSALAQGGDAFISLIVAEGTVKPPPPGISPSACWRVAGSNPGAA
jgi:hypothetical protein